MSKDFATKHPLIILVEDDHNDVELFTIALRNSGVPHNLIVASDGHEGLEKIIASLEKDATPDLVLTDLKMPKVSGIELLQRLRADPKTKNIPVVLFSSSREPKDIEASYEEDANAYVCKPVKFAEFIETVKNIAEFWVLRNESPSYLTT